MLQRSHVPNAIVCAVRVYRFRSTRQKTSIISNHKLNKLNLFQVDDTGSRKIYTKGYFGLCQTSNMMKLFSKIVKLDLLQDHIPASGVVFDED